jgi:hypothetical protein
MRLLAGKMCFALLLLFAVASVRPARADTIDPTTTASIIEAVLQTRSVMIDGVARGLNKCSVDASVVLINAAVVALQAGDRTTARIRLEAALMCTCRLSRELNSNTRQPYRTLADIIDLAVWVHTVDGQFLGQAICAELDDAIRNLS